MFDERPDIQAHLADVIEGGPPADEDRDDVAKYGTAMDDIGYDTGILRLRRSGTHPCPADPPACLVIEGPARVRNHARDAVPGA